MINLDQVRTLEWKVKQAVQLIVHLRRENDTLRTRLSDTEVRLQELETLLETFKASQNELESGIRTALEELDHLDGTEVPREEPRAEPEIVAVAAEESRSLSFDEEFAALAAEEAASMANLDEVPPSVELEASEPEVEPETGVVEDEVAPSEADPVEEKGPEQPGLGIF